MKNIVALQSVLGKAKYFNVTVEDFKFSGFIIFPVVAIAEPAVDDFSHRCTNYIFSKLISVIYFHVFFFFGIVPQIIWCFDDKSRGIIFSY